MPSRPGAFPRQQRIAVCPKARIQLPFGNPEPARRDGSVARERAAKRRGDSRAGSIVKRVALRGQEAESALRVAQLPPRVIKVPSGSLRREPTDIVVRRLGEQ